ncbi:protoporphyrinogen/coproporphyrinogen oxidase [Desulfoscipio gibsoniae]|uniref:Protoporphyrinogen oxidase n=1 Tax=Desulfoscipio gibsoniae DSM 7213 TaxID=767817 RepID=R4KMI1_9FIRM|nr:FAD-dependent oxidoreductase [Desulfoscipio gibsoniae]AGL02767.1 protoporphyrinogen oxidase [Desulfoscipio gibsoniae DSM 7213]
MSSSGMHAVVTLGAGPAGLSFSQHFNHQTDIYEKEASWGGRCRSHMIDGFIFDEGPHSSFTKDVYVKELFAESVEDRLNEIYPKILNRFGSDWVRHPVQTNLKGLPVDLVVSCILDFVKAERSGSGSLENYGQWLIDGFGEKFARTFPYAYTRKYWTVEPEQMTTNWIEQRIYRPDLEQVLKGALSSEINSNHYISTVRYPGRGGFQSFLRGLQEGTKAYYGYELVELDVQKKKITFKNGFERYYEALVSSMPLPVLVQSIKDCPTDIKQAAARLACTSVVLVNLGVARENLANCHWFYIYNEDILPCRVHFPSAYSADNSPPGTGSLQAEVYYSRYKPLGMSLEHVLEKTIQDLTAIGVISKEDQIILAQCQDVKHAQVLYHHQHTESRTAVLDYLEKHDVHCIGRYGEWAYLWSDQSIINGKRLAERLIKDKRITISSS